MHSLSTLKIDESLKLTSEYHSIKKKLYYASIKLFTIYLAL